MTPLINLLPWRQALRQQRAHRWVVLLALVLFIVLFGILYARLLSAGENNVRQAQNAYMVNTHSALQRVFQQRQVVAEKHQKERLLQQIRDVQQRAIQLWERRLLRIAEILPAGAWLSSLTLQKGQCVVKGHAPVLDDMLRLEEGLAQLEGISGVKAGALQHEAAGGFGFTFTLTLSEVANAVAN